MKTSKSRSIQALIATLKLGLAGATIFGIGALILTQNPANDEVGPREAEADIGSFSFLPGSESAKFTEAIAAMGLTPRAYDYNGNVMYFAAGYAKQRKPTEVLDGVQAHLVDYGVNKANHSRTVPVKQAARGVDDWRDAGLDELEGMLPAAQAILDGDVVPTKVTEDHVEMTGMEFNREFENVEDLYMRDGKFHHTKIRDMMGGYKYIESHWEPLKDRSTIVAVWSGEEFDGRRMDGTSDQQSPPDPNVPACMGCERVHRFQGLEPSEPYQANMWRTSLNIDRTYDFYRSTMAREGWNQTGVQPYVDRLGELLPEVEAINGKLLSLERGDESIQLAIIPGERSNANIFTLHRTKGAQLSGHPDR